MGPIMLSFFMGHNRIGPRPPHYCSRSQTIAYTHKHTHIHTL